MTNWINNSSVRARCCLGKMIDELGAYAFSIYISPRKETIAFQVHIKHIDDFEKSKFFIKEALVSKSTTVSKTIWYKFYWSKYFMLAKEKGVC